jgi:PiT family inorganic phosphate transporter
VDPYTLLVIIVATALLFEFANGWNDAANSIATVVSTRVLSPLAAVAWAAFWNFMAAFLFPTRVAATMGKGLVRLEFTNEQVLIGGLVGAILWTSFCTWLGLPISVSHSIMGGFAGAAIARAGWEALILGGWIKPILFIFLAPFIGLALGVGLMVSISWLLRGHIPGRVDRWFRRLQLMSAAAYSLGHGTNDAQKGMGLIWIALISAGAWPSGVDRPPWWVIIACHAAIAGGTLAGGWRVIKTMGQRITKLTPFGGFCAETSGGTTLFTTAMFGIPVSTTHTIAGAIVGVGAVRRISAVRWGVTTRIVWAWVLTIPGAAGLAAVAYWLLSKYIPGA